MAAPVFDAASGGNSAGGTSISYTHTPVDSTNLWVTITVGARSGPFTPTAGTYGGVSILGNVVQTVAVGVEDAHLIVYHLPAPSTGAQTVAFTLAAADDYVSCTMSYTGAHQTTPIANSAQADGSSTAPAVTVTSTTGNRIVGWVIGERENSDAAMSPNSGQTQRVSADSEGGDRARTEGGDDTSDATSTAYNWVLDTSDNWGIVAMEVVEPAAAAVAIPELTMAPYLPA